MKKEAKRWLSEALWDLETAKILHERGRYNSAAFYAHQSAEKALKALLYNLPGVTASGNFLRDSLKKQEPSTKTSYPLRESWIDTTSPLATQTPSLQELPTKLTTR